MKKQRLFGLILIGIFIFNCLFLFKQSLINAQINVNFNHNFNGNNLTPSFLMAQGESTAEITTDLPLRDFNEVIENKAKLTGIFTLYQDEKEEKFYLEIKPEQLNQDFLWLTTLASGVGQGFLLNGMPINNFLFRFERVKNRIKISLPNLNFRDETGQNLANSLTSSFSDSTIYSIPIISINDETNSLLIDLADLFLNGKDLTSFSAILPFMLGGTFSPDPETANFGKVKVFPNNLELDILQRFNSVDPFLYVPVLPDSNNFDLTIHYSLSPIPQNSYRPRLADDRVGYFITAYQDLSNYQNRDSFVRYINRWNLEKTDPNATLSPPKQPIIFWLDRAIPLEYRDTVEAGIKVWNKAFEKIGFQEAIEVKQMPDDADWDPADSRYNTIIWSGMFQSGLLGIGPSHVNPLTGEILDADVIINADAIRYAKLEYENLSQFVGNNQSFNLCRQFSQNMWGLNLFKQAQERASLVEIKNQSLSPLLSKFITQQDYCYGLGSTTQLQSGSLAMSLLKYIPSTSEEMKTYIKQFLFDLIAHEVGHTLGLRHNFHGSTLRTTEELNNIELTRNYGSVGSVMDYTAVNLAPSGIVQGDYYPTTIGPYDYWAIEYGYKPSGKVFPAHEKEFLKQIAQRAPEPELAYGTDEDLWNFEDPQIEVYDLGKDSLNYATIQMENARLMIKELENYYPSKHETYSDIRLKFNLIMSYYFSQIWPVQKHIGGRYFNRDHPHDPNGRNPFETVSLTEQRQALMILDQYLFAKDAFNFSPDLLNRLAPSRWSHWGEEPAFGNLDHQVYDSISWFQRDMLNWLLSDYRLGILKDLESKSEASELLSLSELLDQMKMIVWREIAKPDAKNVNFTSLRRSLQREHLNILVAMVLRQTNVTEDARSIAWYQLRELKSQIDGFLGKYDRQLDLETKAHLTETSDRLQKVFSAQIQAQ